MVPLTPTIRKAIDASVETMATKALRCLALARKTELGELASYNGEGHKGHKALQDSAQYAKIESGLVLVGLVGLQDPPRPEVKGAIEQCHKAGIRVIVITGDNQITAESICQRIGVLKVCPVIPFIIHSFFIILRVIFKLIRI